MNPELAIELVKSLIFQAVSLATPILTQKAAIAERWT